jgi:hypothetical protein
VKTKGKWNFYQHSNRWQERFFFIVRSGGTGQR